MFGYNYSYEPNRIEALSTLSGDISLHGHYAFANLFEGNIVQNIIIDHYWGPSGPHNTFFRNRAELYGIIFYNDGSVLTNYQNVIANEIPNTLMPYGQYLLFGSNHFEYGNNYRGTAIPVSTDNVNINSYYLTASPDFWDEGLTWPSIGYPNSLSEYKIPAQIRFEGGTDLTICPESNTFIDYPLWNFEGRLEISPNPFNDNLSIKLEIEEPTTIEILIWDLTAKILYKKQFNTSDGMIYLNKGISSIPSGIYILTLRFKHYELSRKIIKN